MNTSRLGAQGFGCYEQLKIGDNTNKFGSRDLKVRDAMNNSSDMNDSGSWAQGSWCYEQLRDVNDVNNFVSRAQLSKCYE